MRCTQLQRAHAVPRYTEGCPLAVYCIALSDMCMIPPSGSSLLPEWMSALYSRWQDATPSQQAYMVVAGLAALLLLPRVLILGFVGIERLFVGLLLEIEELMVALTLKTLAAVSVLLLLRFEQPLSAAQASTFSPPVVTCMPKIICDVWWLASGNWPPQGRAAEAEVPCG